MRVRVDLFYRDASNYKLAGAATFEAPLLARDVLRLQEVMVPELGFVPSAVGLDHLAFDEGMRSDDDHAWHDVRGVALEDGDAADARTFAEFVAQCERADWEAAALRWLVETPVKTGADEPDWHDDLRDAA